MRSPISLSSFKDFCNRNGDDGRARPWKSTRLKDEFLGTVSHELRTPLNAILGWIHLLDMDAMRLDERRRSHALATIKRTAEIQTQLVDDLLDVSRIMRSSPFAPRASGRRVLCPTGGYRCSRMSA